MSMDDDDLPLLSNIDEVQAKHYLLKFQSDIISKTVEGTVIIFLDITTSYEYVGSTNSSSKSSDLVKKNGVPIILECCDLDIKNVFDVQYKNKEEVNDYLCSKRLKNSIQDFSYWSDFDKRIIEFSVDNWCIRINEKEFFNTADFPKVLAITYTTKPIGKSLTWTNIENESDLCFFTAGSSINNRSLLPSQDRPSAMATWQAWISVPFDYTVSMTGDEEPVVVKDDGISEFYFYTSMVLPLATIAVAAGKWTRRYVITETDAIVFNKQYVQKEEVKNVHCKHVDYPCHYRRVHENSHPLIPVTVLASSLMISKAMSLLPFVKYILISSYHLIGVFPFQRLEIVILPRSFSSLGFASPSIIYLSKSAIVDDCFFRIRLAHELSHSWFGITIGPKNWEEEWLSEGFATYLEDLIYVIASEVSLENEDIKMDKIFTKYEDFFNLRSYIRYLTLKNEAENVSEEFQILSPAELSDDHKQDSIRNGIKAEKSFMQVHYLKGFFLLNKLNSIYSHDFYEFLRVAVKEFHGCLINSSQLLDLLFKCSPGKSTNISKEIILKEWLNEPKIHEDIIKIFEGTSKKENALIHNVEQHFIYWKSQIKAKVNKLPKLDKIDNNLVYSDQIILLLEKLLCIEDISVKILEDIHSFYNISNGNPETQHRWCELVIKHNYDERLEDVKAFLIEHQCMGVYLYGELMISGKQSHKRLAEVVYSLLLPELDYNSKKVISEMISGID